MGALAPIYNTSVCPLEEWVHVHTRQKPGGPKQIDDTFDMTQVQLTDSQGRIEIITPLVTNLSMLFIFISK